MDKFGIVRIKQYIALLLAMYDIVNIYNLLYQSLENFTTKKCLNY